LLPSKNNHGINKHILLTPVEKQSFGIAPEQVILEPLWSLAKILQVAVHDSKVIMILTFSDLLFLMVELVLQKTCEQHSFPLITFRTESSEVDDWLILIHGPD